MDTIATPIQPTNRWKRRGLIALGLVAVLVGAAGIAWAAGLGHGAFGHGGCRAGLMRERVEFGTHRALKRVNGTQGQEDQILAIVDGLFAKHQKTTGEREQFHQRITAALTGATVDRAALEAIRVEAIQHMDLASKDLVKAVADVAEVLTPAQRQQIAELHKRHFE